MIMDTGRARIEWHGEKAYATCTVCGQLVQLNKKVLGGIHFCLTDCEAAKRHLDQRTRRRGPFWRRRTERYCALCAEVDKDFNE